MCPSWKVRMMTDKVRRLLKECWWRIAIYVLGFALMLISGAPEDDRTAIFVCGGFLAMAGVSLLESVRISHLEDKVEKDEC